VQGPKVPAKTSADGPQITLVQGPLLHLFLASQFGQRTVGRWRAESPLWSDHAIIANTAEDEEAWCGQEGREHR
jgi:hypothetical protein